MAFVLDASLTMSWCFEEERTASSEAILRSLAYTYAEVPALWSFEIANVLALNERRQRISHEQTREFLTILQRLDIRVQHTTAPAEVLLALTRKHRLTAYDAAYLELAIRKSLPLATLDSDLIRIAPLEGVSILGSTLDRTLETRRT